MHASRTSTEAPAGPCARSGTRGRRRSGWTRPGGAGPPAGAHRRRLLRPRRRRRRLHRPLDGASRQGAGPRPRRRRSRGRGRRRGGQRAQRRHLHGVAHARRGPGRRFFPGEEGRLVALGSENLDAIGQTIVRHGIDCGWERTGELDIATAPWQVAASQRSATTTRASGSATSGSTARRCRRTSTRRPTWPASGTTTPRSSTRRAWRGAWRAPAPGGVRICERTPVTGSPRGRRRRAAHPVGAVRAGRVVLATNAFRPLLRRLRLHIVPVYDYALMTEPLSPLSSTPSAGRAGRPWPTPAACSTTTASPRTSASCGAAGTRCTTTAGASPWSSRSGPTCPRSWPITSSPRSRSSRACASPIAGPE